MPTNFRGLDERGGGGQCADKSGNGELGVGKPGQRIGVADFGNGYELGQVTLMLRAVGYNSVANVIGDVA